MSSTSASEYPNRRRFIGGAIATAASYQRIFGANDRIQIGAIGTGGRWGAHYSGLQKAGGNDIVAVCDVYEPRRLQAKARAAAGATDYVDYRQVLDRKDVDAVCIATPDHWHVPILTDAVKAGKDAYCEKPITHTIAESQPIITAVRDSKRIVQIGLQQRSWEHYITGKKDVIDAGVLGQITFIRTYWYQNHNTGRRPPAAIRHHQARLEALPRLRLRPAISTPTCSPTGAGIGISAAAP